MKIMEDIKEEMSFVFILVAYIKKCHEQVELHIQIMGLLDV